MSYFGYSLSNMDSYIEIFAKKNIIVIEDITHRLLCNNNHSKYSTYLIGSLRKWFPIISGGIAINLKDRFINNLNSYVVDEKFVDIKQKAMLLKRKYILENGNEKSDFLELFNLSNCMIENYKNKKMDEKSVSILKKLNVEQIKTLRILNCKIIEKLLRNNNKIRLLYKYSNGDCPLFVPILIKNRDNIRKKMIDRNIYLPIHWPNVNKFNNEIYDLELSLINDQRYKESDIAEYINTLIKIVGE